MVKKVERLEKNGSFLVKFTEKLGVINPCYASFASVGDIRNAMILVVLDLLKSGSRHSRNVSRNTIDFPSLEVVEKFCYLHDTNGIRRKAVASLYYFIFSLLTSRSLPFCEKGRFYSPHARSVNHDIWEWDLISWRRRCCQTNVHNFYFNLKNKEMSKSINQWKIFNK